MGHKSFTKKLEGDNKYRVWKNVTDFEIVFRTVHSADQIFFLARCVCCLPCFISRIFPDPTRRRSSSWFQTFTVLCMSYSFFRLIPWRLNFICRRLGTPCLLQIHRLFRWSVKIHRRFRRRAITKRKEYNIVTSYSVTFFTDLRSWTQLLSTNSPPKLPSSHS